jgi:hypothetical protein
MAMCGVKRAAERHGPAEGETTRLAAEGDGERRCRWGSFPWWTLWLIWPAVGLLKWTAPLVLAAYAELVALSTALLPALLILAGLALIARRRAEV